MKLSDYADKIGVSYKTAHRGFKAGKLRGDQRDTATILITEDQSIEGVNLAEDEREGLLDDLVGVMCQTVWAAPDRTDHRRIETG
jgi:predicted site-specific integrase-resolvase